MIQGLLGKKIGMTQIFDKEGNVIPVTLVETGPCTILELKESPNKIKLGFDPIKESKVRKPRRGFFKKIGITPMRIFREVTSLDNKDYKVGQELKADFFKPGDYVDVTGTSIGKGFQGGMKRWNWSGGGATHGSMHHRRVGSIGASTAPGRTLKGQHMPGHMGHKRTTVQGLRVMGVEVEKNLVIIKGAIPGHNHGDVLINRSFKRQFKSLDEKKSIVIHKVNPMKQSKAKTGSAAKKSKG